MNLSCTATKAIGARLTVFSRSRKRLRPSASGSPLQAGDRLNHAFPYYDLQMPGGGVFLAVGWPGQWGSRFTRDEQRGLHVVAGAGEDAPDAKSGEEVRSPLTAMVFWHGDDTTRAQNLWRRWMWRPTISRGRRMASCRPRRSWLQFPPVQRDDPGQRGNQKWFVSRYLEEGMKLDCWWMDAGWYPSAESWWNTGTWF